MEQRLSEIEVEYHNACRALSQMVDGLEKRAMQTYVTTLYFRLVDMGISYFPSKINNNNKEIK